ncbi:MAG: DUF5916 domain-containing protein [Thermoanaerobaculia bacterium]|nr:DUF5916 domain-containing protein [Thermoanaerobaculia bacterium]
MSFDPTLSSTRSRAGAWPAMVVALSLLHIAPAGGTGTVPRSPEEEPPTGKDVVEVQYEIPRTSGPIEVDGRLDEEAWEEAAEISADYEIMPGENVQPPVRTDCRLTYDAAKLYFGCRALDPEPSAIRAHLSDRDEAFRDDFVGIIVDTFNDDRRAFELFVNPLGVQMDLSRSDTASGNQEDPSWDAIWESAGRITEEGYVVELAIPFHQLEFQHTEGEQTWGVLVFRSYPRNVRHQISNVPFDRGRNCFLCQSAEMTGFEGAEPGRDVELDPTVTALRVDRREDPEAGELESGDVDTEVGLTGTWGVTSNLTLSGTLNPDFSQVEADVAQLEVNERFALFFPERRPFFLEGADLFDTQFRTVHTRNVADPTWGAKLTGKVGGNAIGVMAARDDLTTLLIPGAQSSALTTLEEESVDSVLRYRRDIGESSTVGVLATSREGDVYSNRVGGIDGLFRFTDSDSISFQILGSRTEYPDSVVSSFDQPSGTFDDEAWRLEYEHSTRDWQWEIQHVDIGTRFRADMGFLSRVDLRETELEVGRTWWGDEDDWYTRLGAEIEWRLGEDQAGNLLERQLEIALNAQGPWQSFVHFETDFVDERFRGVEFSDQRRYSLFANLQPGGDLEIGFWTLYGDAVDFANVRPAETLLLAPEVSYRAGRHLRLSLSHTRERLDVEGGRLFTADLSELRSVYQFNVRTFVRAILQYRHLDRDPALYTFPVGAESEQLFTQLLFSYKLNPQTVAFVGYTDEQLGRETLDLTRTGRSFFVKLGYAWVP